MTLPILTVGPVARARNGVIGRAGGLPWRIPSDLQLFKALTLGKPVIMGRKTWESLPRSPLPGRLNVVLTSDPEYERDGALVCDTFADAVAIAREQAKEDGAEEVCVIGGAALFEIALPRARRLYLSEIHAEVAGDVLFPDFDETAWREVTSESHAPLEGDDYGFTLRVLERV